MPRLLKSLFPGGINSSPTASLPSMPVSFRFFRVSSIRKPSPKLQGEPTMSLLAKLDTFKADFEAGKPPYNVPGSVIEIMHRATPS
jgi:hypothetical protein